MPELHQARPPMAAMPHAGSRSAMTRATEGQPFRPYTYGGTGVDLLYEETMPDLGPDPEWYRELAGGTLPHPPGRNPSQ